MEIWFLCSMVMIIHNNNKSIVTTVFDEDKCMVYNDAVEFDRHVVMMSDMGKRVSNKIVLRTYCTYHDP